MGESSTRHQQRRATRTRRTALMAVAALIAILIPAVTTPAGAATPFNPVEDSYVDASKPTRNYGNRNHMRVDASPVRTAYMKFDVQGVGPANSAELRLYAETSGSGLDIYTSTNGWSESTINANNAPALGQLVASAGPINGGNWYTFDVSSAVSGDGVVTLAVATTSNTAIKFTSSEGANSPVLTVPAPPPPASPSPFLVTRNGATYTAASQTTTESYTGTLKSVVEAAASSLQIHNGGTVDFASGSFDLGADHFELDDIDDVEFAGQGIDVTFLSNNSNASTDTEPFDTVGADDMIIRDMTVSAGGALRTTSDALDFDNGNNITVERVKITASRGKGIVFDGKGSGWSSVNNTILDCQISGTPGDGIELLAASNNTITGCTITDTAGHGIQATKSSTSAPQPNKKSNNNVIDGNTITNSGRDGVNINSSDGNQIVNNLITNSSDDVSSRDGIRLESFDGITCNTNNVDDNTATDNQNPKTQRYGLNIANANCNQNSVGTNNFTGNLTGEIRDLGTNTQYEADTEAPTVPTNVTAVAASHFEVDVSWSASTDNVGVTGYTIYRDTVEIGTVGGATLTYRDSTAAAETTYSYTVDAFDAAGNHSAQSSPAVVTTPPAGGSITEVADRDSYVHANNPTRNYGNSNALRVDDSPQLVGYMNFDVSGLAGPPTSATLRVYAQTGSSVGIDAHPVADTTWGETTINYNNRPTPGASIGFSGPFSSGGFVEFDVTSLVSGNGDISFAISTPHTTAVKFSSRTGANAPELVLVP